MSETEDYWGNKTNREIDELISLDLPNHAEYSGLEHTCEKPVNGMAVEIEWKVPKQKDQKEITEICERKDLIRDKSV